MSLERIFFAMKVIGVAFIFSIFLVWSQIQQDNKSSQPQSQISENKK